MKDKSKVTNRRASGINPTIEKLLMQLDFANLISWKDAYKKYPRLVVNAAAIKAYRASKMYSMEEAARVLGVSISSLSAWENGKRKLQWNTLKHLVKGGEFSPEHFASGVEND